VRVLIIEPHASGHHATYLCWLVQAARRQHWSVVIASTPATLSHPSLSTISAECKDVRVHPIENSPSATEATGDLFSLLRKEFAYWRVFKRTVDKVCSIMPVDAIILPYVDYCFYALAALGSPSNGLPWCGISMRLAVRHEARDRESPLPWKWRLAKRILSDRNLKSLFVINPSVRNIPCTWYPRELQAKIRYLPDPADLKMTGSSSEAKSVLGVSGKTLVILVFGSIDERKGIDSLLAAIALQHDLRNCVVILAGAQSARMRKQMHAQAYVQLQARGQLIVIDRYMNDAEQTLVFMAADLVWVGYKNHFYMSGVLVLAGRAGLPVVGAAQGEIGQLIATENLGAVVRIDDPTEVASALIKLVDTETRNVMGLRARKFFADHTVENFGVRVLSAFHDSQAP
jgi:glycosyltransferase involved in cell wall biosynthesis